MKEKLYRSRIDRVFGGVASGLAKYMNIDTILVRVIFIVLTFFSGVGILLYIIMWIVVPEDPVYYNFSTTSGNTGNYKKDSSNKEEEHKENNSQSYQDNSNFSYPPYPPKKSNGSGRLVVGIIFIGFGLLFLVDKIFPYFEFDDFIPLFFVLIGISLLWNSLKKRD